MYIARHAWIYACVCMYVYMYTNMHMSMIALPRGVVVEGSLPSLSLSPFEL